MDSCERRWINDRGGSASQLDLMENEEPGMVTNDHDAIDPSGCAAFGDVGKIVGVSQSDLSEFVLFKGFAVTEIRSSARFQVVVPYETFFLFTIVWTSG